MGPGFIPLCHSSGLQPSVVGKELSVPDGRVASQGEENSLTFSDGISKMSWLQYKVNQNQ